MVKISIQDFIKSAFTRFEEFHGRLPLTTDEYWPIDECYETKNYNYFFMLWSQLDQPLFEISRCAAVALPADGSVVEQPMYNCLNISFDKEGPDQLVFASISGEDGKFPLSVHNIEQVMKGIEGITKHKKDTEFKSYLLNIGT